MISMWFPLVRSSLKYSCVYIAYVKMSFYNIVIVFIVAVDFYYTAVVVVIVVIIIKM